MQILMRHKKMKKEDVVYHKLNNGDKINIVINTKG